MVLVDEESRSKKHGKNIDESAELLNLNEKKLSQKQV